MFWCFFLGLVRINYVEKEKRHVYNMRDSVVDHDDFRLFNLEYLIVKITF
jgi:hypothetical protein